MSKAIFTFAIVFLRDPYKTLGYLTCYGLSSGPIYIMISALHASLPFIFSARPVQYVLQNR